MLYADDAACCQYIDVEPIVRFKRADVLMTSCLFSGPLPSGSRCGEETEKGQLSSVRVHHPP